MLYEVSALEKTCSFRTDRHSRNCAGPPLVVSESAFSGVAVPPEDGSHGWFAQQSLNRKETWVPLGGVGRPPPAGSFAGHFTQAGVTPKGI